MKLLLIIADDCASCSRAIYVLRKLVNQNKKITLDIVNTNDYYGKSVPIVPALLINEEIHSYGDIDENNLLNFINNVLKDKTELM